MKKVYYGSINNTPLETIWIGITDDGLWVLEFNVTVEKFIETCLQRDQIQIIEDQDKVHPLLEEVNTYLKGEIISVNTKIDWSNITPFTKKVREMVINIPYGETRTYGEIANALGKEGSSRAVGRANATNPVPLIIPCHRVIAANGNLQGYGGTGGIATKRWLLDLERKNSQNKNLLF